MDSASLAATAARLIANNGREVILVRGSAPGPDYDPIVGEAPMPSVPTETTARAVVMNISSAYATKVGAENIGLQDRLLLMSANPEPNMEDAVRFDDHTWQIVRIEEVAPDGTSIVFTVQVRP